MIKELFIWKDYQHWILDLRIFQRFLLNPNTSFHDNFSDCRISSASDQYMSTFGSCDLRVQRMIGKYIEILTTFDSFQPKSCPSDFKKDEFLLDQTENQQWIYNTPKITANQSSQQFFSTVRQKTCTGWMVSLKSSCPWCTRPRSWPLLQDQCSTLLRWNQ